MLDLRQDRRVCQHVARTSEDLAIPHMMPANPVTAIIITKPFRIHMPDSAQMDVAVVSESFFGPEIFSPELWKLDFVSHRRWVMHNLFSLAVG